ncbi:MAG: DNA polymerase [Micrococcales bacterium]|nr:DNA polymerase [Micrococcales bacterium]
MARLESEDAPRWVCWSAAAALWPAVRAGLALRRVWDLAEAHRLLVGGWEATPQLVWAAAHGLPRSGLPQAPSGDLFDLVATTGDQPGPDDVTTPAGYLRPDADTDEWLGGDGHLAAYAQAALGCQLAQTGRLQQVSPRGISCATSESAASLLCLELERDGLPIDRAAATDLIAEAAGPRPESDADEREIRRVRDQRVLRHAPGHEDTDLRNPAHVRELLASAGVHVPNTRKWVLEPYRATHPLVAALLDWRRDERIATTYGYHWLDRHVGADDRLRGAWSACDGAAGRMTAQNGLHNLPAPLRPAVAAAPGHAFVRADLGQIEPRVLAVVSADAEFAAATRADDLYLPVAGQLGVERPTAKIAVLAAMYGQRSGAAGEALRRLERAYPVAMGFLDRAYAAGLAGRPVRTFGGRLIRLDAALPPGVDLSDRGRIDSARGRFARNAVIQGAAAELFKAWAATVRATTADLGAQIVLCLHDELLVHVPEGAAEEVAARVEQALVDSARRWSGTDAVRFVADTSVIHRWSEAKG